MKQKIELDDDIEIDDVPASPLLHEERRNRYGSVPGLPDEELAEPAELERQVYMQEFGPILMLPRKHEPRGIRPAIDEDGGVDWGAFGTVDFDRTRPAFDKARFKAERLRDELENVYIMIGIVKRRVPGRAKYLALKYLRMGWLDVADIVCPDMRALAALELRALRLQGQIGRLLAGSRDRLQRELEWLTA